MIVQTRTRILTIFGMLAVLVLSSTIFVNLVQSNGVGYRCPNGSYTNIRSQPTLRSEIMGRIIGPSEILHKEGDWWKLAGQDGYIADWVTYACSSPADVSSDSVDDFDTYTNDLVNIGCSSWPIIDNSGCNMGMLYCHYDRGHCGTQLDQAQVGDEITIHYSDGTTEVYLVTRVANVPVNVSVGSASGAYEGFVNVSASNGLRYIVGQTCTDNDQVRKFVQLYQAPN